MNSTINNIIFGFILGFVFIHVLIYYTSFADFIFLAYRKFFNGRMLLGNIVQQNSNLNNLYIANKLLRIKATTKNIDIENNSKYQEVNMIEDINGKIKLFKIFNYEYEDLLSSSSEEALESITESDIFLTSSMSSATLDLNKFIFESIDKSESVIESTYNKSHDTNEYLVETKGCNIISWPIFDLDTTKLYKNHSQEIFKCNHKLLHNIKINRINGTFIQIRSNSNKKQNIKCYSSFQPHRNIVLIDDYRNDDDYADYVDSVDYTEPVGILKDTTNYPNAEFIKIQCYENFSRRTSMKKSLGKAFNKSESESKKLLIEEIIPLIPHLYTKKKFRIKPNVLLLGLDSISRLNFERHFQQTKKLLKQKNFYTLYGYNKVGLNTFPNMFPLLTGKMPDNILLNETISHEVKKHFDCETLIWKEYGAQNYLTLLVEDWPHYSIFNYRKHGFNNKPTDYYLRPFSLEIDDLIEDLCYNGRTEIQIYYEYVYDFIKEMHNREQSYFAFVFMAHLTHDELNFAGYADIPVYNLLARLFNDHLLDDTILLFFSDHGMRFGEIRQTHSGEIEARLPFAHIYLPKNMAVFTEIEKSNLYKNQHRLTTPFDIHATLVHIINGAPNNSLAYGKSLFKEIHDNRTCNEAGIAEHYCACHRDTTLKNIYIFKPIAILIIDEVNRILANSLHICYELRLKQILAAYHRHILHEDEDDRREIRVILLQIIASPSNASFEATIRIFRHFEPELVGQISRLDKYGNQSHCVQDSIIERFCFCK